MSQREEEVLAKIIQVLKENLNPTRVILFGSRAKGKAESGSDFDIAVDTQRPDITKEREIKEQVEAISGLYGVDIVYLKSTDKKFQGLVASTGQVIYERGN